MKIMKRAKLSIILSCVCAASLVCGSFSNITAKPVTAAEAQNRIEDFANVLDITADPGEIIYGAYSTNKYNNFSDLGAWHGYYLHEATAQHLMEALPDQLLLQKNTLQTYLMHLIKL